MLLGICNQWLMRYLNPYIILHNFRMLESVVKWLCQWNCQVTLSSWQPRHVLLKCLNLLFQNCLSYDSALSTHPLRGRRWHKLQSTGESTIKEKNTLSITALLRTHWVPSRNRFATPWQKFLDSTNRRLSLHRNGRTQSQLISFFKLLLHLKMQSQATTRLKNRTEDHHTMHLSLKSRKATQGMLALPW